VESTIFAAKVQAVSTNYFNRNIFKEELKVDADCKEYKNC
jgi:hypothetical protein